ncbi:flagellar FliJ family protein [Caballeronia sp. dw_19]|jgi:flagellar export protein FliJ|uniref:flagellar FliJ family protein n=1 Tax=Caballeronia sp. dw_19 TaxID=2719791 RepID=UPI001BCCEE08|nr:flagellar FliJ family protein [Caballeronia sp. dw_19]
MNGERTVVSLARLVELRARERDRLKVELASKEALRERYRRSLERVQDMVTGLGQSGMANLALSINCADFKSSLVEMIHTHLSDLTRHEADMEVSQRALMRASLKHEALERTLCSKRHAIRLADEKRGQKRQDQLATQAWYRARREADSIYSIRSNEGSP